MAGIPWTPGSQGWGIPDPLEGGGWVGVPVDAWVPMGGGVLGASPGHLGLCGWWDRGPMGGGQWVPRMPGSVCVVPAGGRRGGARLLAPGQPHVPAVAVLGPVLEGLVPGAGAGPGGGCPPLPHRHPPPRQEVRLHPACHPRLPGGQRHLQRPPRRLGQRDGGTLGDTGTWRDVGGTRRDVGGHEQCPPHGVGQRGTGKTQGRIVGWGHGGDRGMWGWGHAQSPPCCQGRWGWRDVGGQRGFLQHLLWCLGWGAQGDMAGGGLGITAPVHCG